MKLSAVEKVFVGLFAFIVALCTLPAYLTAAAGLAIVRRIPEERKEYGELLLNRVAITVAAIGWRTAVVCCWWIGLKIEGLDTMRTTLGSTGRPVVILMNHTSFLDTLLVVSLVPLMFVGRVKMMVSGHLFQMPGLGTIVTAMGHLSVPFKSATDPNIMELDKEAMAINQQKLEDHVRNGGVAGWFPEGKINPGDCHKACTFRAGGMTMLTRIDAEVWCCSFVGCSSAWPKKAAVGGLPSRIGGHITRLCESTEALLAEAPPSQLPADADERAKSIYIAKLAQDEVQGKIDELVAAGFNGNRLPPAGQQIVANVNAASSSTDESQPDKKGQ